MDRGIATKSALALACAILLLTCEMSLVQGGKHYFIGGIRATPEKFVFWNQLNDPTLPVSEVKGILAGVENPSHPWFGVLTVEQILDYQNFKGIGNWDLIDHRNLRPFIATHTAEGILGTGEYEIICQADEAEDRGVDVFMILTSRYTRKDDGTLLKEENAGLRTFFEHYHREFSERCRENIRNVVEYAIKKIGGDKTLNFLQEKFKEHPMPIVGSREIQTRCVKVEQYLRVTDEDFYGVKPELMEQVLTEDWRQVREKCRERLPYKLRDFAGSYQRRLGQLREQLELAVKSPK